MLALRIQPIKQSLCEDSAPEEFMSYGAKLDVDCITVIYKYFYFHHKLWTIQEERISIGAVAIIYDTFPSSCVPLFIFYPMVRLVQCLIQQTTLLVTSPIGCSFLKWAKGEEIVGHSILWCHLKRWVGLCWMAGFRDTLTGAIESL